MATKKRSVRANDQVGIVERRRRTGDALVHSDDNNTVVFECRGAEAVDLRPGNLHRSPAQPLEPGAAVDRRH
jgi:hypothetical protein